MHSWLADSLGWARDEINLDEPSAPRSLLFPCSSSPLLFLSSALSLLYSFSPVPLLCSSSALAEIKCVISL